MSRIRVAFLCLIALVVAPAVFAAADADMGREALSLLDRLGTWWGWMAKMAGGLIGEG